MSSTIFKNKESSQDGRSPWQNKPPTGVIVLANGTIIKGRGLGAVGAAPGEVCFNTAMLGYQEILTDPSYAGQIVTFTFPHVGNVGANPDDIETSNAAAASGVRGCILRADVTAPSNYRSQQPFDQWLKTRGIIGVAGVDTRALTTLIREQGMPNAIIAHNPEGEFDLPALLKQAKAWPGILNADLAKEVTALQSYDWAQGTWNWDKGFSEPENLPFHVVAVDYGIKRNILRCLVNAGCRVTVVPAHATAEEILARRPDGVFLSNGPGDPAATAEYAVPAIKGVIASGTPLFGICLGHQLLGLSVGARTIKMPQGHHGANHPVMDFTTGKVEITSMNHGFTVDTETLPPEVEETHISLFDRTNCGIRLKGKPVFAVQYHPEASPGPQDSHYLFTRFVNLMRESKGMPLLQEAAAVAS